MRKKKIPLLYHCTIFMLYYVCDLLTMPEDDEILKNGTGDFSRIRKDSFYWYKKVIESCGEKL